MDGFKMVKRGIFHGVLLLAVAVSAQASLEPYAGTSIRCARSKTELAKADPRLQQAFASYAPFNKQVWEGKYSDIHIDENGAVVHVHPDLATFAKVFAGEEAEQPIAVYEACLDLNNKPFLKIGDSDQKTVKIYLNSKTVTLKRGANSDTFALKLAKSPNQQTAKGGSQAKALAKPVLN